MNDIIFGINPITQLLQNNPNKIKEIFVNSDKNDRRVQHIVNMAQQHDISVQRVDLKRLERISEGENHQGVVAKLAGTTQLREEDLFDLIKHPSSNAVSGISAPLILILDGVQDPHNLGACLRTADAAGVTAVVVPKDNAASITPVVRKVASGAAETVPLIAVTNLARVMREIQELGVWIVGTDSEGEQTIYNVDLNGPIAIVLGSEGEGMRQLTRKHCDFLVKLPMFGQVESLNVSVATGVCLYEAVRQRLNSK